MDQNDVLREDNYFVWTFNARMSLEVLNLHGQIDALEIPNDGDPAVGMWKVNVVKAFAIIATMISPKFHLLIRSATSTDEAWEIMKNVFVPRNTHNRIQIRRQVHEFKMEKGWKCIATPHEI